MSRRRGQDTHTLSRLHVNIDHHAVIAIDQCSSFNLNSNDEEKAEEAD